jgi:hypothetical protein
VVGVQELARHLLVPVVEAGHVEFEPSARRRKISVDERHSPGGGTAGSFHEM